MLKTNKDRLIMLSVMGKIYHPNAASPFQVDASGMAQVLPATGGITYNVKVGDLAQGWASDHTEPGVTIKNSEPRENLCLNTLACLGNSARVVTGDAKGAQGIVTGTHGGLNHVIVYFQKDDLEKMVISDNIQVKSWGGGLKLVDFPTIHLMNIDPVLLEKLVTQSDKRLKIKVAATVPPYFMGSGLGTLTPHLGDYDIMTTDNEAIKKHHLDKLRLGDIVSLKDCMNTYGRSYQQNYTTIGVVIHGDSVKMGHGPGVTAILCGPTELFEIEVTNKANIADCLGIS